jgi:uncharacterized protein YvpB
MDIIGIISSFEVKTALLFLLFCISCASIFFSIHVFLAETEHKHKIAFVLTSILLWTLAGISGWRMALQLIAVPAIAKTTPTSNGSINSLQPIIAYTFTTPIDLKSIVVNTQPAIDLDIKPQGYFGNRIPIGRRLILYSKTTLPPGEQYMVYLSNIEGPFTRGYGGEHLLEVHTSALDVVEVVPDETVTTIKPNQTFTVKLNEAISTEKEWMVTSVPEHAFTIRQSNGNTLAITPQTPLKQAAQYAISIIHIPTIHRLGSDEEIQKLAPTVKKVLRFTTVRPPILATIEPQGSGINPTTNIKISFDTSMDRQSVIDHLSISPNATLTPSWDTEGKILTLTHATFPKDTGYTLSLKKGIKTLLGGVTESDLTYQFHTAGPVGMVSMDPVNGAKDAPATQPIKITFDQEVPSQIADYITISPDVTATASGQGRTLTLYPKTPLAYETLYSVTLKKNAPSVYGLTSIKDQVFSFTTSSPALAVPYFKQQSLFTCNLAAARMLLAYRGIAVTEQKLIDIIGIGGKRGSGDPNKGYIDDYGTYWDPVFRGVSTYRPTRLIKSGKLEDIIAEIKRGNPVMTWGQNGWSDPHDISWTTKDGTRIKAINGMHSAVVRGYTGSENNPTQILLNDPWRGQYSITAKEFMRRWGYFGVAMVVD